MTEGLGSIALALERQLACGAQLKLRSARRGSLRAIWDAESILEIGANGSAPRKMRQRHWPRNLRPPHGTEVPRGGPRLRPASRGGALHDCRSQVLLLGRSGGDRYSALGVICDLDAEQLLDEMFIGGSWAG